jgi:hypothetical protein
LSFGLGRPLAHANYSESKDGADDDFTLVGEVATEMDDATASADECDVGIYDNRKPFGLHTETEVPARKEFDPAAEPKRKACEGATGYSRKACRSDAADDEGSGPGPPVIEKVFVREVSVELI